MGRIQLKIVAISDTHLRHDFEVPEGDVLVHAGDLTMRGTLGELDKAVKWLGSLPHERKVVIAGNHDFCFQECKHTARDMIETMADYLQDDEVYIDNVKFYGSPWQLEFNNWAFNLERGEEIKEKWDLIPEDVDVLITHGPPHGYGDRCADTNMQTRVGCEDLIQALDRVKPKLHIFGHIHEDPGIWHRNETTLVNACVVDLSYELAAPPQVFEI